MGWDALVDIPLKIIGHSGVEVAGVCERHSEGIKAGKREVRKEGKENDLFIHGLSVFCAGCSKSLVAQSQMHPFFSFQAITFFLSFKTLFKTMCLFVQVRKKKNLYLTLGNQEKSKR